MAFFKHFRIHIVAFIIIGFWTSLPYSTYRSLLRIYSIFILISVIGSFSATIYFEKLYTLTTLSNTVANSLYVMIVLFHIFILFESIVQSNAQTQLIEKFTLVEKLFKIKLNITIPYKKEKSELFMRNVILFLFYLAVEIGIVINLITSHQFDFMFQFD